MGLLGIPTTENWPELELLPCTANFSFEPQPENHLKEKFAKISDAGVRLFNGLFTYDPKRRITAENGRQSDYFGEEPLREYSQN